MSMRQKLEQFMRGRYGVDQFGRFTLILAVIFAFVSLFLSSFSILGTVFTFLELAAIFYTFYRMLSRDIYKRSQENQKYLNAAASVRNKFGKARYMAGQRKEYHIYSCPDCGQKIRIPRGKGKIEISCPKCHNKFIKKS